MRLLRLPGVFRPRSDSLLLAGMAAERVAPGARVLDPFTGSGILAVAAALAGAGEVTAIDVSRRAVLCARLNARLNGVRVRGLRGDLFEPVAGQGFELIVANPPYLPGADTRPRGAMRAWEGGADGRRMLDRLCREAAAHLTPGGELLLVQSSISDDERTLELLAESGLRPRVLSRRRGPLGPLLASRATELERRGLIAVGQREEEILVIGASRSDGPPRPRAAAGLAVSGDG